MTPDQDKLAQSAHAQELKVIRILTKTLGISRSQARREFRLQQAQRNFQPAPLAPDPQLFQGQSVIRRTEVVVDPPLPPPRVSAPDPVLVPTLPVVNGFGIALPTDEGKYDLNVDDEGEVTWQLDTVPNAPDAIPGEDHFYVLQRNSSADPVWVEGVDEAPLSGGPYWRNAGTWDEVDAVEEAPIDGLVYGRKDGSWYDLSSNFVDDAVIDSVTTLMPGDSATASVTLTDGTLHFTFDIPRGDKGETGPSADLDDLRDFVIAILVEFGLIPPP